MLSPDSNSQPVNSTSAKSPPQAPRLALAKSGMPQPELTLGQIVITSNAHAALATDEVTAALRRHRSGDWGMVCPEDWKSNDRARREQGMVLSAYESANGTKFFVITDPGHEITTLLLPEDY